MKLPRDMGGEELATLLKHTDTESPVRQVAICD
jgi:hypothetical protein